MTAVRIPLLVRPITRWAERLTFQQQLSVVVAIGVLSMTLLSSLASAWQATRQVRSQQLDQSLQVASSLAAQSRLALLSGSADNVREAMTATLAFPDVLRIEVRTADNKLLASQGSTGFLALDVPSALDGEDRTPQLAAEDDNAWYVVAPVWSEPRSTPFDVEPAVAERLGQVTVVLSKATLAHTVTNIFLVNVGTSLLISVLFLGMLRWLSQRLSRPLQSLSQAMSRAEHGESEVRTLVQGPQDVQRMAAAFNRMISAEPAAKTTSVSITTEVMCTGICEAPYCMARLATKKATPMAAASQTQSHEKAGQPGTRPWADSIRPASAGRHTPPENIASARSAEVCFAARRSITFVIAKPNPPSRPSQSDRPLKRGQPPSAGRSTSKAPPSASSTRTAAQAVMRSPSSHHARPTAHNGIR